MIRSLAIIAAAGFVLSLACFSAAIAVAGPEALMQGAWTWGGHSRNLTWERSDRLDGASVTRELAWTGGESLVIEVPADVTYTQAPGPAKLTVTGLNGAVNDLVVEDGRIRRTSDRDWRGRVSITMTAPDVKTFGVSGSGRLMIDDYDQDRLSVDVNGSGDVSVEGRARDVVVDIAGSGRADLGEVSASSARVEISGSGSAVVAPKDRAQLQVSGSGEIDLKSTPAQVESEVSGSGHISRAGASEETAGKAL